MHYMLNLVGILAVVMLNNDGVMKVDHSTQVNGKTVVKGVCKVDQDGKYSRGKFYVRLTCDQFKEQLLQLHDEKVMVCYTMDKVCSDTIKSKEK